MGKFVKPRVFPFDTLMHPLLQADLHRLARIFISCGYDVLHDYDKLTLFRKGYRCSI